MFNNLLHATITQRFLVVDNLVVPIVSGQVMVHPFIGAKMVKHLRVATSIIFVIITQTTRIWTVFHCTHWEVTLGLIWYSFSLWYLFCCWYLFSLWVCRRFCLWCLFWVCLLFFCLFFFCCLFSLCCLFFLLFSWFFFFWFACHNVCTFVFIRTLPTRAIKRSLKTVNSYALKPVVTL